MTAYFDIDDERYEAFNSQFGFDIKDACETDLVEFLEEQGVNVKNIDNVKFSSQFWWITYEVVKEKPYIPDWADEKFF